MLVGLIFILIYIIFILSLCNAAGKDKKWLLKNIYVLSNLGGVIMSWVEKADLVYLHKKKFK